MEKTNIIGKRVERVDAYEKVTGRAIYGDDIKLTGMLYAANRYADVSVGFIKSVNIEKAEKVEGVVSILQKKDIPDFQKIGPIRRDHYVLVDKQVNFSGDVIAIVAATSLEAARKAADLIEIEYEHKDGVFDPREALKDDAPLVHPDLKSNLVVHYPLKKGDINRGFEESDIVIERSYQTPFHEHAYIEPETVTVIPDPTTKGYKVYGSIQNPFTTRNVVSIFMNCKLNQVNVISSVLGGSFGGKDDVINGMACRAAALCRDTGKPIKLTNTREGSLKESYKRHPYYMTYKVGVTNEGIIKSMKIDIVADSGAYSSQSFFVTWRSVVQATGPYEIENVETDIRAAYTNNTYTAAYRGFGSPQIIFAQESLMDELADIIGITPLKIRRLNGYKQGSVTASGQKLDSHKVSLNEVIDEAIGKSQYLIKLNQYKLFNESSERYKKGIGLACSFRGASLGAEGIDTTAAIVSVQADGSIYVIAGLNENGQGLRTTFCQIAAEILGTTLDYVQFLEPQTGTIADGGPTVASRGTLTGGNAVQDAAEQVKFTIFNAIKERMEVDTIEDLVWRDNQIISLLDPEKKLSFSDGVNAALSKGYNTSAYGWFKAPDVSWDEETGQGNAYFTYVYGCQIAEVQVDTYTGKMEMLNMTAAHDVGKVINLTGIEGQVYGGVAQGIGYAILENYNIQSGVVKSENFDEYLLPTIKDIPNITPILVENKDPYGPFGAKSIGEPTLELGAAAINNAYSFIAKKWNKQIPLTLERVFLGKELVKKVRQSEIKAKERCDVPKTFDPTLNIVLNKDIPVEKTNERVNNLDTIIVKDCLELKKLLSKGDKSYKLLAGGTDVVVQLRKQSEFVTLLDISKIDQLKQITDNGESFTIGGGVTFSKIIGNQEIKKHFPLLVEAVSQIGSTQIRNRATIAGNIVNAAPCADSVPPLVLYGATVVLKSETGEREILVEDFIKGSYKTDLKNSEFLHSVVIPKQVDKKYYKYFYKLGRRNALNITRMSVTIEISFDNNHKIETCKIVPGSVFARPQRVYKVENYLKGKILSNSTIDEIEPIIGEKLESEIGGRWSSPYKVPVFKNLLKGGLLTVKKVYENDQN